jgi:ABC-type cobalamin/Fe3+-siderophores transport system ATPase subunit
LGFPTTSHRRTTVAPTEYVVDNRLPFKTTIILKKREDIVSSISELIEMAIIKALDGKFTVDDIVFELEQTPDERFKLKHIISPETLRHKATFILNEIVPLIKNGDQEEMFSKSNIKNEIDNIISSFIKEIETQFEEKCSSSKLFIDECYVIEGIDDKEEFIKKNRELLANEAGSISVLVEYIRIQGDLLADWFEKSFRFVLIDGEGIGHSLGEKRDTLSTRHHDYFDFCNSIILVENSSEPFTTGGQGAIESIFLNGYRNKFKLVFSKTDKLNISDQNSYFRRNIRNLSEALKNENVDFSIENKDTFKLANLNKPNLENSEKKEIERLLTSIHEYTEVNIIPLEYDFDNLFINLDRDRFVKEFQNSITPEHWTVIKAFSKRLFNKEIEYKRIRPVGWILRFIMQDINLFLRREDDLQSDVSDSQNKIKQNFSKKLIRFIYKDFVVEKNHLWLQAYEKSGLGSDRDRKKFIFDEILKNFLPAKESDDTFDIFKKKIRSLLLDSGAKELKSATKISIDTIDIKKIYDSVNFKWNLRENVNILLGKNGSGKSTIIKLVDACINNNMDVMKQYGFPYVELAITKEYENGDKQRVKITNSKNLTDVNSILISTFDIFNSKVIEEETYLDSKLSKLVDDFGKYQRSLTQIVAKETEKETSQSNEIRNNIADASTDKLIEYRRLSILIDEVTNRINAPIKEFKSILDSYFSSTNKIVVVDDEKSPLLLMQKRDDILHNISLCHLSSGEKQLLIIFLTVVLQKNRPFILLMDEPETSLHVEWQSTIIDNIYKLQPNIQIIVATHNPLMALNRNENEIGVIKLNKEEVFTDNLGSKYLDISTILLKYFELPSLIGIDMQRDIREVTRLKLREIENGLNDEERMELKRLKDIVDSSYVGEVIYNEKYFSFLKFIKDNKGIDFDELDDIDENEFQSFLTKFGDTK